MDNWYMIGWQDGRRGRPIDAPSGTTPSSTKADVKDYAEGFDHGSEDRRVAAVVASPGLGHGQEG